MASLIDFSTKKSYPAYKLVLCSDYISRLDEDQVIIAKGNIIEGIEAKE